MFKYTTLIGAVGCALLTWMLHTRTSKLEALEFRLKVAEAKEFLCDERTKEIIEDKESDREIDNTPPDVLFDSVPDRWLR